MHPTHSSSLHPRPQASVVLSTPRRLWSEAGDIELLGGLLTDDGDAWREFNARYARLLYSCIARITARFGSVTTQDDVREIYATLCLQLLANDKKKLRSFEAERGNKLGSWLGMLAIHTTYDYLRSVKREPRWSALSEAESLAAESVTPFEASLLKERARILTSLIEQFSDKDRQFIQLYFGEGMEPEDIARSMKISVKTVYSKKHKITSRLEALLAEQRLAA